MLNYKGWKTVDDARQALEQACPKGVDVYFGIVAASANLSHDTKPGSSSFVLSDRPHSFYNR